MVCCGVLWHIAVYYSVIRSIIVCCGVLWCVGGFVVGCAVFSGTISSETSFILALRTIHNVHIL